MPEGVLDVSRRRIARTAGVAYLLIIACGLFAEMGVRAALVVPDDPLLTARRLAENHVLLRASIAADLVMLICDVIVGVALWTLLRRVSAGLATLALALRLMQVAVYGTSLLGLFYALHLVGGGQPPPGITAIELPGLLMLALEGQSFGYVVGLTFFGLNCAVTGWLLRRSDEFPSVLGVLLMVAAVGYLVDCGAQFLVVDYAAVADVFQPIVLLPALVAELGMALYMVIKGVRPTGKVPA